MDWINFDHPDKLSAIISNSELQGKFSLVFKHSTRCPISSMALHRLEKNWKVEPQIETYFLDLIRHRSLSNEVANKFGILHESPQLLLVDNAKVVYHTSHNGISAEAINSFVAQYMQNA